MKQIIKNQEPAQFTDWKNQANENWKPTWDNLAGDVKQNLHQHLINEQGGICCYCQGRIDRNTSHIEHFRPRSKPEFEHLILEYENLLSSCQRVGAIPPEPLHCGHLKADWFEEDSLISPLSQDCENHFRYAADGNIYPSTEADYPAQISIDKLGLNISYIRSRREAAIDGFLYDIERITEQDLQILCEKVRTKENGIYFEYGSAIEYVLRNFFCNT